MTKDIYTECPLYKNEFITLRQTTLEDASELLLCYSDEKSVPFFNADNCHGDDFHYKTLERMEEAIAFWNFSYLNLYFVRWTVILNETQETVGTIEMFHRTAEDAFNHFGVLRIDLKSECEISPVIDAILDITQNNFFDAFDVNAILTKSIPLASERTASLLKIGYVPLNKKLGIYDDYYVHVK
jgi:ribosomal-protein-alanine N-acetyltransferase